MLTTPLAVLAISLALAVPQAQDPRAEAERLAAAGAYAEALKRFQAIAAANPGDTQARLWIGRLHLRMGEPGRAAAVFESIVATEPQNVDALVGLGQALTAEGRGREAADALNRAEAIAADRVDVLAAQGALHASEGRSSLGLAYYARALALDPTSVTIRDAVDAVRAARAHHVELGYDLQHFNIARDDSHTGTVGANLRLKDTLRLLASVQIHRNLVEDQEVRGGGGLEWMPTGRVRLRGGLLAGGNTLELPQLDVFGTGTITAERVTWGFDLRFADFDGADLLIGGPTLAVAINERLTGYAEYHRGRTRFVGVDSTTSDNVTLGARGRIGRRLSALAEYRYGIDRLEWLTFDRLVAHEANTFSVGGAVDLTPFVTLGARYDHHSRPGDLVIQRGSGRLHFRF